MTRLCMVLVVAFLVPSLIAVIGISSYLLCILLNIPLSVGLPLYIRLIGLPIVAIGVSFLAWVFEYRRPIDMTISTYLTIMKILGKIPIMESKGREEGLVIMGPYKYVRHPLYFGVLMVWLGLAILLDQMPLLILTLILFVILNYVVASFEEKELIAIFGDEYMQYMSKTPKLIPLPKRRRETN